MSTLLPELAQILDDMVPDQPAARITMTEAASRLRAWSEGLSDDFLATRVWEYCPDKRDYTNSERERKLE